MIFTSVKRLILVLALALPALVAWDHPAGAQAADASRVVAGLAERAIPVLTRSEIPEAERERQFRGLLREGFQLDQIARLVLGRYWGQASPAEQTEFVRLLEEYLVQLYASRFADFQNVRLQVEGSRDDQGGTLVRSILVRPQGPPVPIDWRVEQDRGRFVVTDLVVEGVSMVITQRSEFASVIRQRGGQVEGLLQMLRQKTRS